MFKAGVSGNPKGRPKGTLGPRKRAFAALDQLMAKSGNQEAFKAALEAEFNADPMRFFKNVIMPLLPRNARLQADAGDQVLVWGPRTDGDQQEEVRP